MNPIRIRTLFMFGMLGLIASCATTTIAPEDCPSGTQKLAGCPPLDAVTDSRISKLYEERTWINPSESEFDPIEYGRNADIPINNALAKFIGSTDEGGLTSLAAKLWMIEHAEHTIDVMYYIFRDDLVGHALMGALCDAVERGVDVRFMTDSLGASDLDKKNVRALASCAYDAGFMRNAKGEITVHKARVQPAVFNATSRIFVNANRRSHDKLIVKDGHFGVKAYAITGGRNVSLDYYGIMPDGSHNPHTYRDADILVRGSPDADEEEYTIGDVAAIYYTLLFHFKNNNHIDMLTMRDPVKAYAKRRQGFSDSLATLKSLPRFKEVFDTMPQYMSEGFHDAKMSLAHELANLTDKHVVTNAVENAELNPNSIMTVLSKIEEEDYAKVRIVSPYIFAAEYKEDGEVVLDEAQKLLDWLDAHPDSTIELITNSVLTGDNTFTQAVIDMNLVPRLLLSEELREQWLDEATKNERRPELVESEAWLEMVNHPRLFVYETGRMDDVRFGGTYHHSKLHAKYITGDDEGFVGTTNYDYRSRLYNNEMGFAFESAGLTKDIAKNTDYLISIGYRWGSPEWLEMRARMSDLKGNKAYATRHQRGLYKSLKNTGAIWWF